MDPNGLELDAFVLEERACATRRCARPVAASCRRSRSRCGSPSTPVVDVPVRVTVQGPAQSYVCDGLRDALELGRRRTTMPMSPRCATCSQTTR